MANTTSITGPAPSNPFSQISSAFAPIYSMFGSPSGASGGGTGSGAGTNLFGTNLGGAGGTSNPANPFGVGTMDPNNPNNVQMYANLANLLGLAGPSQLTAGSNIVGQGMGVTGAGLDVTGAGLGMFQQPYNYLSQLASGNPATVAAAAAPTAAIMSGQENQALMQNRQGTPAGGAQAVVNAGLPQQLAAGVGNYELGLQPAAEQGLQTMGSTIAGIGQGMSSTGQQIAGTGTTMTGQAEQTLQNVILDALQKTGLNYQYGGPQTFNTIMQGIGSLLGGAGNLAKGLQPPPSSGGGCWIAEAIYGVDDRRTHLVRAYLNGPFRQTASGRLVMSLYVRFGRAVARQVQKHSWLKGAFRPLFDRALGSAMKWVGGAKSC